LADSFNGMLVRLRQIESERLVLLGGLPHDLRAPLTRLRLRLATFSGLDEHPGIADDIASIDRIVRQFSEYLRGVQPNEPRQPLHEIVRAAVESYQGLGRDVQMEGDPGADVLLPQFAVRRLVDNLIENASQHGQEPISVRVGITGSGGAELRVADHGPGIPADAAEAALQPFTKLDPARGRGSCGLGLAIVRQLARQLGGGVRFERGQNYFAVVVSLGVHCAPSLR
jgi:two-component system osmolarity sensor histidine kinase EnvZ